MCVCMCGFCKMWVFMCGFSNVLFSVCLGLVMCWSVYMWVL